MNSLFNQYQSVYSLDTSALIAAFRERYPIENFPAFWHKIEELIRDDRLKMSEVVFEEAMRENDIKEWCDQNALKQNFQSPIDESMQIKVNEILREFPKLIDDRRGRSGADPWAIALAMISQNCIVVTEEKPTHKGHRPNIPDVCAGFNVEYIQMVDLIKRENWIF